MDENLRAAALQAIANVFETMFFVFLEPLDPGTDEGRTAGSAAAPEWLLCTVGFQGRVLGSLRLWVPYGLAQELATNFLGLETEASEIQALDMVKELANMVCGNLFSLYDRHQATLLDLPSAERVRRDPGPFDPEPGALRLDFLAEDRRIRLELQAGPAGD